jgi:hypothetical protein
MRKKGLRPRITIGTTINIGNHEFVKVEVEGASSGECVMTMKEVLKQLGKNEVTREMIQLYQDRVIG